MQAALWISMQAAVVAWWLWMDWDRAIIMGTRFNPGLALALGCFFALLVTAGIARLLDAKRFGWSASEPPPIARADKIAGNLFIVRVISWPLALFCFASGALRFTGETSGPRMLEGLALIALAVAIIVALRVAGTWLTQSASSFGRDMNAREGVTLTTASGESGKASGKVERFGTASGGAGESAKLVSGSRVS